mgnify:CR=1 FL=1
MHFAGLSLHNKFLKLRYNLHLKVLNFLNLLSGKKKTKKKTKKNKRKNGNETVDLIQCSALSKTKNKEKRTIKFSPLLPDPFMNSLFAHDKFGR